MIIFAAMMAANVQSTVRVLPTCMSPRTRPRRASWREDPVRKEAEKQKRYDSIGLAWHLEAFTSSFYCHERTTPNGAKVCYTAIRSVVSLTQGRAQHPVLHNFGLGWPQFQP